MVFKMTEWYDGCYWHCACVDNLAVGSGHWLHGARILGIPAAEYVEYVIKNYNPIVWHNSDCSILFFKWEKQSDERRFKNFINKKAREYNNNKGYII